MKRRPSAVTAFAIAAAFGLAGGWLLAERHDRVHRRDLFSAQAWRRFAALGWIVAQDDVESVPLLRDYLAWEPLPALRQRAKRVLGAFGATA